MQVVVHLRTVDPSDAHCDDRIADDGRGGKRSVQCSVFRWRRIAGDRERECVGVWVCGEREGSNKVQGFKGKVGDRERVGFKEKC